MHLTIYKISATIIIEYFYRRKHGMEEFIRSEILLGKKALEKLQKSKVIVFGTGGVGSYVCEALARSGVGAITVVDNDTVSESNINRQLIALHSTIGRYKADVAAERIADINPRCKVSVHKFFYLPETADAIDLTQYDYIVDAIDTVTAKIDIICRAEKLGIPIISSMGTGNKLNAEALTVTDIFKTSVCPLARVMRRELKTRGIKKLTVLYSPEPPITPMSEDLRTPGSVSFVPSVGGLLIGGHVVRELIRS